MLEQIKMYIRNLPYLAIVDRKEHEYCKAFFETWKDISAYLSDRQSALEMGLYIIKKTCEFYLAEWCGLLKVDMDIGVWTPEVWYDRETGAMEETLFDEFEFTDHFPDWVNAMAQHEPVVITDIGELKDKSPLEYQEYCRLEVQSVIGVPIDKEQKGLFVVKNLGRFCDDPDFMIIACSLLMLIFDYGIPETKSLLQSSSLTRSEEEIRINFLGHLEIVTAAGSIREDTVRQNRTWKILIYLLCKERAVKAYEMVQDLWPDEPEEKCMINIRGAIYRFRQRTAGLTDDYLIVSLPAGYCINPKYSIITDAQELEAAVLKAKAIKDRKEKADILKSAFPLYRGSVFESMGNEPWIMTQKARYNMLYVELVNVLLDTLYNQGDEEEIREYALKSLEIEPGNPTAHYHLINSIKRSGGSIQINLKMARKHLTEEEFDNLCKLLSEKPEGK